MPAFFADRSKVFQWCAIFCIVLSLLIVVLLITQHAVKDQRQVPIFIGGYCAMLSAALSIFQILEHLSLFGDSECQTKVVRILFMVPLYAVCSWISICAPTASEYIDVVRDAYESYAIYAFFALMISQMGGIDALYRDLMVEQRPPVPHAWPFNKCLEPMTVTPVFVQNCRLALFQFMIAKPLISICVVILTASDSMGKNLFDPRKGYFWTSLFYNISITIAFMGLAYFYLGMKEFLVGKNAFPKFLCVKAVIFLSYWQGIVIAVFASFGALPKFDYWKEDEVATGLQDFLICIEMLFIAFAHKFCFPAKEFQEPYTAIGDHPPHEADDINDAPEAGISRPPLPPARRSIWENLKFTLRHEDVVDDARDIARSAPL